MTSFTQSKGVLFLPSKDRTSEACTSHVAPQTSVLKPTLFLHDSHQLNVRLPYRWVCGQLVSWHHADTTHSVRIEKMRALEMYIISVDQLWKVNVAGKCSVTLPQRDVQASPLTDTFTCLSSPSSPLFPFALPLPPLGLFLSSYLESLIEVW